MKKHSPTEDAMYLATLCGIPSPIWQSQKHLSNEHPTRRLRQKYSNEDLMRALFQVLYSPGTGVSSYLDWLFAFIHPEAKEKEHKLHKLPKGVPTDLLRAAQKDKSIAQWLSILSLHPYLFQGGFLLDKNRPPSIAAEESAFDALKALASKIDVLSDWLAESLSDDIQMALGVNDPRLLKRHPSASRLILMGSGRGSGPWWDAYVTSVKLRNACKGILRSFINTGHKRIEKARALAKEAESTYRTIRTLSGHSDRERRSPVSLRRIALYLWLRLCLIGWERRKAAVSLNDFFHRGNIWKGTSRKEHSIAPSAKNFERILYAELKTVLESYRSCNWRTSIINS
jgi:hypothetical protein